MALSFYNALVLYRKTDILPKLGLCLCPVVQCGWEWAAKEDQSSTLIAPMVGTFLKDGSKLITKLLPLQYR